VITEFFIWIMAQTSRLVLTLFPRGPQGQDAADGVQQGIGTVLGYATGFGHWIPWNVVGPALALCIAGMVTAGGIRLVRIIASFLTLGGGSAA
jgi:hypothetical protein